MKINKNKIKKFILFFILIYVILWCLYSFVLARQIATSAINSYLDNININKEDIESLEIKYDFKIGSEYLIKIRYKDEPDLSYEYYYKINDSKLVFFTVFEGLYGGSDITIDKKIIPTHESFEHVYGDEKLEMKYSLFDYIYEEFPDKFIPQYNILIILFIINLIILLLEIIYKSKNLILKICFIISIFTLILVIICFNSILNYLDLYNLSGNTIMFYIYITTIIFNIISIIIPIFKKISQIFK